MVHFQKKGDIYLRVKKIFHNFVLVEVHVELRATFSACYIEKKKKKINEQEEYLVTSKTIF